MKPLASCVAAVLLSAVPVVTQAAPKAAAEVPPPAYSAALTCVLQVKDLGKAVDWYVQNLRFAVDWRDDAMGFAELRTPVPNVRIGLARQREPNVGGGVLPTFGVLDLDAAAEWFAARGIATDPIIEYPGVVRLMTLRDHDGNLLQLYQHLRATPAEHAGLEGVAFLAGSWIGSSQGGRNEEHWTAPNGGLMVGMSRSVHGGRAVFFEHLRIERRGDAIVYVAAPKGRAPVEFVFDPEQSGTRCAVFTNPEHDFPKRITYRLAADGALGARIDDGTDDGRHQSFRWLRGEL